MSPGRGRRGSSSRWARFSAWRWRYLSGLSHTATGLLSTAGRAGYTLNLVNVVFNLIPVQAAGGFVWDGRKILAWSRAAWLMLVAGTAALVIVDSVL
jgi:Zn-dependent protease